MISDLHSKVNPLKYAIITVQVSRQYAGLDEAIKFLDLAITRLKGNVNAQFLLRIGQAEKKLNLGQHHDCLEILTAVSMETEPMADIDPKVYSAQADVFAQYYRRKEDYENYYRSGLTFLAYTVDSDLDKDQKFQWSTRLGMAVLLGKKIFNIQELLDKEILKSLLQSDFEWLFDLL